jgi:hypothetical protein
MAKDKVNEQPKESVEVVQAEEVKAPVVKQEEPKIESVQPKDDKVVIYCKYLAGQYPKLKFKCTNGVAVISKDIMALAKQERELWGKELSDKNIFRTKSHEIKVIKGEPK